MVSRRPSDRPFADEAAGAEGDEAPLPPLETRWLVRVQGLLGASGVLAGAAVAASGAVLVGATVLAGSAVHVGVAVGRSRVALAQQLLGAARDAVDLGRFDEAEVLLERAARLGRGARRAAAVVRASMALDRDDPAGAAVIASGAIGEGGARRPDGATWIAIVEALGVRALARAATGDADGTSEDAARLASMLDRGTDMGPDALGAGQTIDEARARAALATALGLVRSGDRDALREHLAAHEVVLRDLTRPRERALHRGVERMLAGDRPSPYRAGAAVGAVSDSGDDWVTAMLPTVAPFIPARPTRAKGSIPAIETARLGAQPGDWSSARRISALVASWVLVAAGAFAVGFLDVPPHQRGVLFLVTMLVPLIYAAGIVTFAIGRGLGSVARRQTLADAIVLHAATGDAGYLEEMTKAPEPLLAAQAMLVLARRKNLAGAFAEARALAEAGLERTRGFLRHAESASELRPALVAELALAHAGLGDLAPALAHVESIPVGWAHRARARFAVRLVALAASGDVDGATALAEHRPADLPVDRPIEALADVLRAHAEKSSMGLADRARLTVDLQRSPELRAWVERLVPNIVDAMDLDPVSGQRVRAVTPEHAAQHAAEDEALAAELEREEAAPVRRLRRASE